MYRLTIIAVGGLKEPFWKEAIAEYAKRLTPFAKTNVVEVKDIPFKSAAEAPAVLRAEAEGIRKKISDGALVIALVKEGKSLSTEQFSELLRREGEGGREIVFVIGGPLGLDPELAKTAHARLSLSALTFTHGEARVILFEQIYRAMTVQSGKTYHY
jgi:23S rRNA (pseudouridine1915-N3)-methyltransferase